MRTFAVVLSVLVVIAIGFYIVADVVTSGLEVDEPNQRQQAKMLENIEPVARVNIGSAPATATEGAGDAAAGRSGEQVYSSYCAACHVVGVAGAPKTGDTAAWSGRVEKGMDAVLANATNGLNAMPPKGTCADCSADELRAAIEHMLKESGL
ncbi:MAG: c-type cytochrome [Thiogranum sp.]|nr:c-type cytochrome [Thiogranum sp.]